MKVRVYYDGYKNQHFPQHRWYFIWRNFKELDVTIGSFGCYYDTVIYSELGNAIEFLNEKKESFKQKRESEAAVKERSKKSGVVYEDTI